MQEKTESLNGNQDNKEIDMNKKNNPMNENTSLLKLLLKVF